MALKAKKTPSFQEIPLTFPRSHWECDYEWRTMELGLDFFRRDYGLELEPDFQRGHVWTFDQRSQYIEHCLRGGETGRVIVFNGPSWDKSEVTGPIQLLDGLQRITTARLFMDNQIPAFGYYFKEYKGILRAHQQGMKFRMLCLETRKEVLEYYIAFNFGGTPHHPAELLRVRALLDAELAQP